MKKKRASDRAKKAKKSRTLEYVVGIVVLVVIVWGVYGLVQTPASVPSGRISRGDAAPNFTLPIVDGSGLTGQSLSLSQFKGKIIVLEFMVSWCPHCQNMAPIVERLHQQYAGETVVFISVAATWNGADARSTAEFIRTYRASWVHVLDQRNSVFQGYGVDSTPAYFIIDSSGAVQSRYDGEQVYATLAEAIARVRDS